MDLVSVLGTKWTSEQTLYFNNFWLLFVWCLCSGLGLGCISIGLVIRVLVTFLLVHFGGFNLKEKVFIAVAWLPKATVQVRMCVPQQQDL